MLTEPCVTVVDLITCPVIEKIWKRTGSSLFEINVIDPEDVLTKTWSATLFVITKEK